MLLVQQSLTQIKMPVFKIMVRTTDQLGGWGKIGHGAGGKKDLPKDE